MASTSVFSLGGVGCEGGTDCCGGCTNRICVEFCNSGVPGVLVQVKSGATVIASGTTDATGCVSLNIGSAGTYTVVASLTGFTTVTGSHAMTCGGGTTITFSIPTTLFLTDSAETVTLTYNVFSSTWVGCVSTPVSGAQGQTGIGGICSVTASSFCDILYELSCAGTTWTLTATWGICFTPPPGVIAGCAYCGTGFNSDCSYMFPACPGPTETVTGTGASFPFTLTYTGCPGNGCSGGPTLPFPLGCSVSIDV